MKELLFGTAGIPISTEQDQGKRDTIYGLRQVNKLNLSAMELEFVHSVNIKEDKAPEVNRIRKENNLTLTCHGQYYINLNSLELPKVHASVKRVLNAARIANLCGAWSLVFHAAFYMKLDKELVYNNVKLRMKQIIKTLKDESNPIWVRPETTGKPTQWGDLDEILRLSQELEQVMPCIDFSHMHARNNGGWNTKKEFEEILTKVEKALGKEGLDNMHIHLSGINYGEKGEKNHLILKDSDMNYKDLLKSLKEYKVKGVLICESPNIEKDAIVLKKTFHNL